MSGTKERSEKRERGVYGRLSASGRNGRLTFVSVGSPYLLSHTRRDDTARVDQSGRVDYGVTV